MVGERPARSDSMSEVQKQSHFILGIAALFMEAGGVPPPSCEDALRLSPGRHAGRRAKSDQRAVHPLSHAREGTVGGALEKNQNKATLTTRMLTFHYRQDVDSARMVTDS
jgi:hypothetical protein